MGKISFVLGGARSGKTAHALALVTAPKTYIATATAGDGEMADRITAHQAERGADWRLIEAEVNLPGALADVAEGGVVIDCLTLWLSNLMMQEADIKAATDDLIDALKASPADVVLVSNEIGMGLVPMDKLSRDFRDAQGRLNQTIAAAADQVEFVAAGLPIRLK